MFLLINKNIFRTWDFFFQQQGSISKKKQNQKVKQLPFQKHTQKKPQKTKKQTKNKKNERQ